MKLKGAAVCVNMKQNFQKKQNIKLFLEIGYKKNSLLNQKNGIFPLNIILLRNCFKNVHNILRMLIMQTPTLTTNSPDNSGQLEILVDPTLET